MPADALRDAIRIGVVVFGVGQGAQPVVDPPDPARVLLGRVLAAAAEADAVANQPAQLLRERRPFRRIVLLIHLLQLAKQVHQAVLTLLRLDRLSGSGGPRGRWPLGPAAPTEPVVQFSRNGLFRVHPSSRHGQTVL